MECAGLLDFVRSCQNLTDFDIRSHHALLPFGGGGFNRSAHSAEPTPRACGLVIWFFGDLVVVVCSAKSMLLADFWRQQALRMLAKWLFGGLLVVLRA